MLACLHSVWNAQLLGQVCTPLLDLCEIGLQFSSFNQLYREHELDPSNFMISGTFKIMHAQAQTYMHAHTNQCEETFQMHVLRTCVQVS